MPGTSRPGRMAFGDLLKRLEGRIRALETQQQTVITDPINGDPLRGYAIFVTGALAPYGLTGSGAASYRTGTWVQL